MAWDNTELALVEGIRNIADETRKTLAEFTKNGGPMCQAHKVRLDAIEAASASRAPALSTRALLTAGAGAVIAFGLLMIAVMHASNPSSAPAPGDVARELKALTHELREAGFLQPLDTQTNNLARVP